MSEVSVSASVNIQLDIEVKTTMKVSDFSNIAVDIIDGVIDETLDVEKVDVYGMHSVTSTSGNPPDQL